MARPKEFDQEKALRKAIRLFSQQGFAATSTDDLNKYDATTHFVGQTTIFTLAGDRATGEAYCLAHHVTVGGGMRRLMLASLRYVDWVEERALS
jgi:SnoaL-like protein